MGRDTRLAAIRSSLAEVLVDASAARTLAEDAPLLDAFTELDSLGITNLVLAIEERLHIYFDEAALDESVFISLDALERHVADLQGDEDVSAPAAPGTSEVP